jgi:phosphoribosylformylglycinamidine synthase
MKARIHVTLRPGVLDPQGQAVANALAGLGFDEVREVRQGKYLEIDLAGHDRAAAVARVDAMCRQLLANPVVEKYAVELVA